LFTPQSTAPDSDNRSRTDIPLCLRERNGQTRMSYQVIGVQEATMKKAIRNLGIVLLLCAPLVATAQTRATNSANRERAMQIGASVKQIINTREPGWKLKLSLKSEFGTHEYFKLGNQELEISILVYDSPEEAS